ncbi:DUF6361 family protein [Rhizobium leguminosarum]|uniref:DUF6361 family protein n=1 Tax=Rhizobium leguminosarum TaxID=384 RepID=UPI001C977829|nr:DUF6361 family protein [Rhizobium leguminosarum]
MQPRLGWVWLSQTERRAAEAALSEVQADGARDELGFGVVHFAYADRFFPGTSVLHTSVRYSLFVCWAYLELLQRHRGVSFPSNVLADIEDRTGRKLMEHYGRGDGNGIIGGRVLRADRRPVTRPSRIYWNALKTWGLLATNFATGSPPNQSDVHRRWSDFAIVNKGLEVDAVQSVRATLLDDIPPPPADWSRPSAALSFELPPGERKRLRKAWERSSNGGTSLLSRLANRLAPPPASMYHADVLALCDPDETESLKRAQQVASLVCIGRTLYAAMVNDMKDGSNAAASRRALDDVLSVHQKHALALNIEKLRDDVRKLNGLKEFLDLIQEWANSGGDYSGLVHDFRVREYSLKDSRALLLDKSSARRVLWSFGTPQPLTYRWGNVTGFLNEIAA